MKEIKLTKGYVALVDDEDYDWLSLFNWQVRSAHRKRIYACTTLSPLHTTVLMHRIIMNASHDIAIDHKDQNGLNNQKDNLRFATREQNGANRSKTVFAVSSRYKGVAWHKGKNSWTAHIMVNQRQRHLGRFRDEESAARAYNKAALEHFGEFARLNEV